MGKYLEAWAMLEKAQPAFEAWLKEFKALDEQVRQDIVREQAKAPAKP